MDGPHRLAEEPESQASSDTDTEDGNTPGSTRRRSDPLSALQTDDRVLITGPPMTGKYDLLHRFLANRGTGGLLVSVDRTAERSRADHTTITRDDRSLHVLECVENDSDDSEPRTRTASIGNLTGVGVAFTAMSDSLADDDVTPAVALHSLSHLLAYSDVRRVNRFVHTMSGQVVERGWPFLATLNSTAHDEQTRHALYERFDRLLETRIAGDGREFRVRSQLDDPTAWKRF